jgi:hypothetical protein
MRLFRRARDTKTSVIRREAVSAVGDAASMAPSSALRRVTRPGETQAPPSRPSSPIAPVVDSEPRPVVTDALPLLGVPPSPPSYEGLEDSDVFVCNRPSEVETKKPAATREVTLFVHRWHNVEPGLLSWSFPSLRAALDAVQRMKNAVGWCVVSGTGWSDLDAARRAGAVLVEQLS